MARPLGRSIAGRGPEGRGGWAMVGAMVNRDGNGWTTCGQGHRHWGRFGAAGLLPRPVPARAGQAPGRDRTAGVRAAAAPELVGQPRRHLGAAGRRAGQPRVGRDRRAARGRGGVRDAGRRRQRAGILRDDHGGWSYQTVIAAAPRPFPVRAVSSETSQASWVAGGGCRGPGPASRVRGAVAGAARGAAAADDHRRRGQRDGLAARRLVAGPGRGRAAAPRSAGRTGAPRACRRCPKRCGRRRWNGGSRTSCWSWRERRARSPPPTRRARAAPGRPSRAGRPGPGGCAPPGRATTPSRSWPRDLPGRRLVVTADRELRGRCVAAGASVTGPGWLLGQL